MKNKHLVLLFLVVLAVIWFWNSKVRSHSGSLDSKLATEFLARYKFSSQILIADGTEPDLLLQHHEHGWLCTFGRLHSAADEDSLKAFFSDLKDLKVTQLPVGDIKMSFIFKCDNHDFALYVHQGDTLSLRLSKLKGSEIGLLSPAVAWGQKPYASWLFRKLQVKPKAELSNLVYEWHAFPALELAKMDGVWTKNSAALGASSERFIADTLLTALTQLNQLEPALLFDPITEALQPFARLHLNDGKASKLSCFRRTESNSEFFLQSDAVPNLFFELPDALANTIFVRPALGL